MLDEGVESHSNDIHRICWRRTDSAGKVHDLFLSQSLRKFSFIYLLIFDLGLKERVMACAVYLF